MSANSKKPLAEARGTESGTAPSKLRVAAHHIGREVTLGTF